MEGDREDEEEEEEEEEPTETRKNRQNKKEESVGNFRAMAYDSSGSIFFCWGRERNEADAGGGEEKGELCVWVGGVD
jgi:hypothetical protein